MQKSDRSSLDRGKNKYMYKCNFTQKGSNSRAVTVYFCIKLPLLAMLTTVQYLFKESNTDTHIVSLSFSVK